MITGFFFLKKNMKRSRAKMLVIFFLAYLSDSSGIIGTTFLHYKDIV